MLIGAMNHPICPLAEEIDQLAGLGFDLLELAMDPPMAHSGIVKNQQKDICARLARHRMRLICHLPTFVYPADLTPSIRKASIDELIAAATVASELKALKIVLHPPLVNGLAPQVPDISNRYVIAALDQVIGTCLELGLKVCLENMFPAYGGFWHPDHFTFWLNRYPELSLTLDAGHAHIGSKSVKAAAFIQRHGHRVSHLHLSDNNGRRDQHLALGKGTVDFQSLARATKAMSPELTATLEVFSPDRSQLAASRRLWLGLIKTAI